MKGPLNWLNISSNLGKRKTSETAGIQEMHRESSASSYWSPYPYPYPFLL